MVAGFVFVGVVLALLGAGLMLSALIPEDAMVAVPLPQGNTRRILLPVGVLMLVVGVVLPTIGVTTIAPPPTNTPTATPTLADTATSTRTPTRTPPPTIAIVQTATPRPPTNTPRPATSTPPGTTVPQQSLRGEGSFNAG
ncbi:MAG: hypothetical protein AAFV33_00940 [Chloroflexota bacterium]